MSWDVSLTKFSQTYESIEEIPDDAQLIALGTLREVQQAVSAVFPGTDWKDPHWGVHDSEWGSIEFSTGKNDPVQGVMLHVRASETVVIGIRQLCERMGCQAIDMTDGSFLDRSESPAAGLAKWAAYRDRVVGSGGI